MLTSQRKVEIVNYCRMIFINIDANVKGNNSMAQMAYNRIEQFVKTPDELSYAVDAVTVMISKIGKNPELAHVIKKR